MLRATDVNCVIDVGANVGQFGIALRRAGYRGCIVLFEPVRRLDRLAGSVRLFSHLLTRNAHCFGGQAP